MYDELIIDQIKKQNNIKEERPQLELPLEIDPFERRNPKQTEDDYKSKVITIDLNVDAD